MLKHLRQRQRGLVAWLLPVLLLAWNTAAAGLCAHAFGQQSGQLPDDRPFHDHEQPVVAHGDRHAAPSYAHADTTARHGHSHSHSSPDHDRHQNQQGHQGGYHGQDGHDGHDSHGHSHSHGHADDCAQYCLHCDRQAPAPVQSIAVCGDPLPGVAMVGHQNQAEPDCILANVFVPESSYDPAGSARVDPPPDPADSAETIPINLRHCVFLN